MNKHIKKITIHWYISDGNGNVTYADLKKDLQKFIQSSVDAAVEKSFQSHFTRMTALIEMEGRPKTASEPTEHPVEQHVRISGEVDLHNWNAKLADSELCNQYVSSFYKNVFLCEPVCSITCHRYCFINSHFLLIFLGVTSQMGLSILRVLPQLLTNRTCFNFFITWTKLNKKYIVVRIEETHGDSLPFSPYVRHIFSRNSCGQTVWINWTSYLLELLYRIIRV